MKTISTNRTKRKYDPEKIYDGHEKKKKIEMNDNRYTMISELNNLKTHITDVDETKDILQSEYPIKDTNNTLRAKICIFTDVNPLSDLVTQLKTIPSTINADITVYPLDRGRITYTRNSAHTSVTGRKFVLDMFQKQGELCDAVRDGDDGIEDYAAEQLDIPDDNNFIMTVFNQDLTEFIGICFGFFDGMDVKWNDEDLHPLIYIDLFCGTPSFKGVGQIMMNMLKLIVLIKAYNEGAFSFNSITVDGKIHNDFSVSTSGILSPNYSIYLKSLNNGFTESFYNKSGFTHIVGLTDLTILVPYIWFLESYLKYAASMIKEIYIPFYGPSLGKLPSDTASPRITASSFIGPDEPTDLRRQPSVTEPSDYYSFASQKRNGLKAKELEDLEIFTNSIKKEAKSTHEELTKLDEEALARESMYEQWLIDNEAEQLNHSRNVGKQINDGVHGLGRYSKEFKIPTTLGGKKTKKPRKLRKPIKSRKSYFRFGMSPFSRK